MKKTMYALLIIINLGGCNYSEYVAPKPSEEIESAETASTVVSTQVDKYDLFYEIDDYTPSLYEPEEGVYLGAYVLSNRLINYSIEEFERRTGREHLIYTYHMKLGEELPLNWVLECASQLKTPLIVIDIPNERNPFDMELLMMTAESFDINIPIFIEFYPNPSKMPVTEYIDFYRTARNIFAEMAPNCAFIFSVSSDAAVDELLYYPGDEFTDWVGINIYMPILEGDIIHDEDIFNKIDMVYYTFQRKKPIMVSQLAVSHFTSRNHTYYTLQAADTITNIYTKIAEDYPRIKGVIYMDFNNVELKSSGIRDNFTVTGSETVLRAYSQIIKNNKFISELSSENVDGNINQLMKSPFAVKKIDENYYMPDIIYYYPEKFTPNERISDYSVDPLKKHIFIYLKK